MVGINLFVRTETQIVVSSHREALHFTSALVYLNVTIEMVDRSIEGKRGDRLDIIHHKPFTVVCILFKRF